MKVLMILRTRSVANDERVTKEAKSIAALGLEVEILASEARNENTTESLAEGVNVRSKRLWSAKFLGRLSVLELNLRAAVHVGKSYWRGKRITCIWLHDPVMFLGLPLWILFRSLNLVERIVWDHHELPPAKYSESSIWRWLLGRLALAVDINIQANEPRKRYFFTSFTHSDSDRQSLADKTLVIRNYPWAFEGHGQLPEEIRRQLPNQPFVYVQSGFGTHRNFDSLARALAHFDDLPVVFTGSYPREAAPFFENPNWTALGRVQPAWLPFLFRHAQFTIILYQQSFGINNWLCEPNRLFHALSQGCPVLAGNNPPMCEFIELTSGGLVLSDDGGDASTLIDGIAAMRELAGSFSIDYPVDGHWDAQVQVIARALDLSR